MGVSIIDLGSVGSKVDISTLVDIFYPVGKIWQSFDSTNPQDIFPGTQWQQITGRFLRAANDTGTGGSDTVTLTVDQMPSHTHVPYDASGTTGYLLGSGYGGSSANIAVTGQSFRKDLTLANTGGSKAHNNMPSYQNVYTWKRIA